MPPVKLVIFDVDGTLLDTSGVDDECYARAMRELWGIGPISTDWGSYSDSTDAGILDDLLRSHLGRPAGPADVDAHQARFVELLESCARTAPHRFRPIPGAGDAFARVGGAGWRCAIATGGWRASALLKLAAAALDIRGVAAAFADDHRSREGIIRAAWHRAGCAVENGRPVGPADRVVYVGDGVWDLRAARALGIGFIGVGRGERAALLDAAGAGRIVENLETIEAALAQPDGGAAAGCIRRRRARRPPDGGGPSGGRQG